MTTERPFQDNLALLTGSCRDLNQTGQLVLEKAAARHLRNLDDLHAYVGEHPEVMARPLDGAVVVTGLPRTGTTLLHNLLALDPAHRVLRFWEALHPAPDGPSPEQLQAQAERWLASFYRLVPDFRAIHGATPTGPEECDALLQNTFASQHFDDMFDAPEYSAWLASAALTDEYAHYALQLRVLTSGPARWALKSPSHLGHLDALASALAGVTVVICHRHPHQAVPSYASLIHTLRRAYSDTVSPAVVGHQALARTAVAMRRALAERDRLHVLDVDYRELVSDPVVTVRRLYQGLDREFEPALEAQVAAWTVEHPQHRHGPHRYDLASFGLTGDEVDDAFGDYMDRFA